MHALPSSQLPQAVHAVAPGAEVVPAGHAEQLDAPVVPVNEPAAQGAQTAFADPPHALAWKDPASQTLHALHTPPFMNNPGGQLPHWLAPGPKHAVQLASHALQTVFVVEVHVADGYVPAPQTVHAVHEPPLRYLLAAQLVH